MTIQELFLAIAGVMYIIGASILIYRNYKAGYFEQFIDDRDRR